jgi:hypothetical protein
MCRAYRDTRTTPTGKGRARSPLRAASGMRSPNGQRTNGAHGVTRPTKFIRRTLHSSSLPPSVNFGVASRAGCDAPYQMERLRSHVAITVSSKLPVTFGSDEATAPQGEADPSVACCYKVERVVLNALGKHMRLCRLMILYLRGLKRHRLQEKPIHLYLAAARWNASSSV